MKSVKYWLSVCRQFEHETNGFSLVLHNLTDDELTNLKPVAGWFLDFAPFMFKLVHRKEHARLRTVIAYLTALQGFQADAWKRKNEEYQTRLNNTKAWVRKQLTT